MAALNFKRQFVEPIRKGIKRGTVRALRKYPIEPGEKLYLYTGMRTKYCEKIADASCSNIFMIRISGDSNVTLSPLDKISLIRNDGSGQKTLTSLRQLNDFAKRDGFSSWPEMKEWWADVHGLPFSGVWIKWHWHNIVLA